MQLYQPTITGSLSVSGSINISGSINVVGGGGTITGTASYATNAELLDGLDSTVFTLTSSFAAQTASFTAFTASVNSFTASQLVLNGTYTLTSSFAAQTASFTAFTSSVNTFTASINSFSASVLSYTSSLNAKTSSFATTGSNTFEGIQTINSNLTVTGSITAQTLIVSTINATQSYSSGSNIFGNNISNTQTFTGSLLVTGSSTFSGALTVGATTLNGNLEFASGYFINMPWVSDTRTMWERYNSATYFQRISSNGSLRQLRIESNGAYGNASIVLDGQSNTTVTTTITSDKFVVVGASAFTSSAASPFTLYATDGSGEGHKIQWQTAYGPNRIVADIRGNASGAGGAFIIRVADTSATLQERLTITNVGKVTIPSAAYGTSYFSMNYTSSNAGSREWVIGSDTAGWGSFSIGQATTQGGSTFSDKLVITSDGTILVGGASSTGAYSFSLGNATANTYYQVRSTNTNALYGADTRGTWIGNLSSKETYSNGGHFVPGVDNTVYCGSASYRWAAVYAANGAIQTSDQRLKTNIQTSDLGLDFITQLNPVSYKWIVGGNTVEYSSTEDENGKLTPTSVATPFAGRRTHYGLIAQQVKQVLGDKDFGGYVYDEETDTMSLRYDQFISPLIKAVQELKTQNDDLQAQITELKNK